MLQLGSSYHQRILLVFFIFYLFYIDICMNDMFWSILSCLWVLPSSAFLWEGEFWRQFCIFEPSGASSLENWESELDRVFFFGSTLNIHIQFLYHVPSWPWSYGNWIYNYLCNQCLSPLTLWVRILLMARQCTRATLCDKVCPWLVECRWFSQDILVFSSNKTHRHDITEILLKVAINVIHPQFLYPFTHCCGQCILDLILPLSLGFIAFLFICFTVRCWIVLFLCSSTQI